MTTAVHTKINRRDLKIYASERLTDNDDGGGMPLGTPLKGEANELFNPISNIERINGAFHVRLEYAGVLQADDEPLIGSYMAITKPPKDQTVSYLLCKANYGETRKDMLKRIEAYNTPSIESRMTLLGNQSQGSKIVQCYQENGERTPMVGDRYCLIQNATGYDNVYQYIQVTKVTTENRRFYDGNNNAFWKTTVKLEISQPLKYDFVGIEYPIIGKAKAPCKVYETYVSDSARYYGVKPLVQAIDKEVGRIQLTGIMEKIVPVTVKENAIADMPANTTVITLDTGYETVLINGVPYNTAKDIPTYLHSYKEDITLANRSYSYTAQLINPQKGMISAKYMAQGKWYELKDNGFGKLVGENPQQGVGTINYDTGSVIVECGEMPDVGSALIISYAKSVYKRPDKPILDGYLPLTLTQSGANIVVKYGNKTGTVQGDKIVGEITGEYQSQNRLLKIVPNAAFGTGNFEVNYQTGGFKLATPTVNGSNSSNYTLGEAVVKNSLSVGVVYREPFVMSGITPKDKIIWLADDGKGGLVLNGVAVGTIDYDTGNLTIPATYNVEHYEPILESVQVGTQRVYVGDSYTIEPVYETRAIAENKTIKSYPFATFVHDGTSYQSVSGTPITENFNTPNMLIDIAVTDVIVNNSLIFAINNNIYQETDNGIMKNGVKVGERHDKQLALTQFDMGLPTIKALAVKKQSIGENTKNISFTVPKLRPASLKLKIDDRTASADVNGSISYDDSGEHIGYVDVNNGVVMLNFRLPVKTITWQGVALSYLPVASELINIDTVRLPQDGRVPIFRRGDSILIGNRQEQDIGSAFTGGSTIQLSRGDLDRICVNDADGKPVNAELWDYDLEQGSITWKTSIDLSPYKMPLKVMHAQEERNVILEVDIDGNLTLRFPTKRAYPLENTYVSSLLIGGDLQVWVSVPFTQKSWDGIWRDEPNGSPLLNKLNITDYPMTLTDDGAITAKWLIKWLSSTQFELYADVLGFVGKYDTLTNLAPINLATGKPYFTLDKRSFGNQSPWATQDVIRFNTRGTLLPVAVICAVQPSSTTPKGEDGFTQCLFGDTTEI